MSTAASKPLWPPSGWAFVRQEMAPFPGRWNPVLRTLLSSALIIVISMTLQIPFLALSLIMVFFITQANAAVTRMVGMMFFIGIPVSTCVGALLLKYTYGYPLIRLVSATAIFCVCMFFLRVSRFSLLFFVVGFVTIYVQSLVDLVADPEALLRTNLWVGAATWYAVVITLLVNTLFLPIEPAAQLNGLMQAQLARVRQRVQDVARGQPLAPIAPTEVEKVLLGLNKLLKFAGMRDASYLHHSAYYLGAVTVVSRLVIAAANLPIDKGIPDSELAAEPLVANLDALAQCLANRAPFVPVVSMRELTPIPALNDMQAALEDFARTDVRPDEHPVAPAAPFMVADASSNPLYFKFVLKTCLATLLCYVFYNGVDWPGIHTIMLTSVITSLPNLGASAQKATLRVSGCLLGAVLSIGAMVFVVPHLDTLFGLLAMSLSVVALSAWVCAGSDKVSYAGTQIIFCFALALLEDFGPVYDLTLVRDRVIGIVLGVVITTAIHTFIWPVREGRQLLNTLGALLRSIAHLVDSVATPKPPTPLFTLGAWNQLADAEAMGTRVSFEPDVDQGARLLPGQLQGILASSRGLLMSVHDLAASLAIGPEGSMLAALDAFISQVGRYLEAYAAQLDATPDASGADLGLLLQQIEQQHARLRSVNEDFETTAQGLGIEKLIARLRALPVLAGGAGRAVGRV